MTKQDDLHHVILFVLLFPQQALHGQTITACLVRPVGWGGAFSQPKLRGHCINLQNGSLIQIDVGLIAEHLEARPESSLQDLNP